MPYAVQEPPSPLWNDALAYWPGSFVLTGNAENEGWQYVARLYTDVLPENGTPMISSYPGPGGVPSVYAQDCSADPVVGSPLWMSCLASEPVGISRTNSGPMVLQNGNVGGTFNPSSPMGRIIFEGTGLGVQQDLITLDDSNQGVNLFSTSGFRPQASAADCAISGDGNGGNHGLALRCANTISNYISHLPDGSNWLEQLTTTAKSFKVHNIVLSNGDPVTNPPFTITVPTPAAARTLAITDPGGNASFGLSLGSTTIAGPTSMITAGACGTSTGTIPLITSANNTLIVTPQASLNTYRGMAVDAYISATGMITLEVCNASSGSVTPGPVNFTVRAF